MLAQGDREKSKVEKRGDSVSKPNLPTSRSVATLLTSPQSARAQKKFPIGSCHYAPNLNYQPNFHFWEPEDIPVERRKKHDEIVQFIDPDILGLKRRTWINSTNLFEKKRQEEACVEEELVKVA